MQNTDQSASFSQQNAQQFLEDIKNMNISNDTIMETFKSIPENYPTNDVYGQIISAMQAHRSILYVSLVEGNF